MITVAAWITFAIWLYLVTARGRFWLADVREDSGLQPAPPARPPRIAAVVPARDEAAAIGRSLGSLVAQDYPGPFEIVVVDDCSRDGTASLAREAAAGDALHRATVIEGRPLPPGWAGKMWAVKQGVEQATSRGAPPDYLLLTDADIVHAPHVLSRLCNRAEEGGYVLVSVMARLRCESFAERATIPAFVFFFQMLYPFAWVNRRGRATAAAAGGCMLVSAAALAEAGGVEAIRDALIDDCALAKRLKAVGPIWLGLGVDVESVRAYERFGPIRRMVTRSAYTELRHSPARLAGAVAGMAITFLAPPLAAALASGDARLAALAACALMLVAFQPILRFYRLSPLWAFALPAIAALYTLWTVESAVQHRLGRGGNWKGRIQAPARGA